jgi:hypothetical protein
MSQHVRQPYQYRQRFGDEGVVHWKCCVNSISLAISLAMEGGAAEMFMYRSSKGIIVERTPSARKHFLLTIILREPLRKPARSGRRSQRCASKVPHFRHTRGSTWSSRIQIRSTEYCCPPGPIGRRANMPFSSLYILGEKLTSGRARRPACNPGLT